jgi:hypothetical protein
MQVFDLCIDVSTGLRPAADWKRSHGRPRRTWLQQLEEGPMGQQANVARRPLQSARSFGLEVAMTLYWSWAQQGVGE